VGRDASAANQELAAIALKASASYDLRSKAASALNGQAHPDLGSGELNLLAETPNANSATAADRFYFYQARIRAARAIGDQKLKLDLLTHCIVDFPRRDEARVPLFETAAQSHSDEFALAVIEPLLDTPLLRTNYRPAEQDEVEHSETEAEEEGLPSTVVPKLSRPEQARVGEMIGDLMLRLDRLSDAQLYFQTARRAQELAGPRKLLEKKTAEVKAELRVQAQNAARRPILHAALEQDRIVRPRLAARSVAHSPAIASKGGQVQ
jgi:hypothetical protein